MRQIKREIRVYPSAKPVTWGAIVPIDCDVHQWLTFNHAADRRTSSGGTAEAAVQDQLESLRALVGKEE